MTMEDIFNNSQNEPKKTIFRAKMQPDQETASPTKPKVTLQEQQNILLGPQPIDNEMRMDPKVLRWRLQEMISKATDDELFLLLTDIRMYMNNSVLKPTQQKKKGLFR
jgi:hypothetical protein